MKLISILSDDGKIIEFCHPRTGEILSVSEVLDMNESLIPAEDRTKVRSGKLKRSALFTLTENIFNLLDELNENIRSSSTKWKEDITPESEIGETDTGHWEHPIRITPWGDFCWSDLRKWVPGASCIHKIHPVYQDILESPDLNLVQKDFLSFLIESIQITLKRILSAMYFGIFSTKFEIQPIEDWFVALDCLLNFNNQVTSPLTSLVQKLNLTEWDLSLKRQKIKKLKAQLYHKGHL